MAKTFFEIEAEQAKEYAKKTKKVYKQAYIEFTESIIAHDEVLENEFRKIVEDLLNDETAKPEADDDLPVDFDEVDSYLDDWNRRKAESEQSEENRMLNRNIEDIKNFDDTPVDSPDVFID